jgi:hypothetical protein
MAITAQGRDMIFHALQESRLKAFVPFPPLKFSF